MEMSLRALLRIFGLKAGTLSCSRFDLRIRDLAVGNQMLEAATEPMLRARACVRQDLAGPEPDGPVSRQQMFMPRLGPLLRLAQQGNVDLRRCGVDLPISG